MLRHGRGDALQVRASLRKVAVSTILMLSIQVLETREKILSSVWATVAQPLEQLGHLSLNNATAISKNLELGPRKTESADLRDVQSRISTVRSCCRR